MTLPEFSSLDVENIYIYVADAVRWDSLPSNVHNQGTTVKTVSASIHSPASFASIVTGRYLPTHGVTDFRSKLPEGLRTIFDIGEYCANFFNTLGSGDGNDPIYGVLDQPSDSYSDPFETVSKPFIIMERAQGGHAPYGSHSGTAAEYFETHQDAPVDSIRNAYKKGIRLDANRFLNRLKSLAELGLKSETLVIYTSDHGELLGEGGMFGHNGPIRPELVYVPTVFIHPQICEQTTDELFGHTDILPTVAEALDIYKEFIPEHREDRTDRRYSFYETNFQLPGVRSLKMQYNSVWNSNGGTVITDTPSLVRAVGALDDLFDSQQRFLARRWAFLPNLISSYRTRSKCFGSPNFSFDTREDIEAFYSSIEKNDNKHIELSESAQDRLHDLGYS